ncbi:Gfo/Idh/MocA family oxidoreductase [Pelomonas sp. CA6]|uniref:Gfo/Idh/MocA family protein n=1 Tax=Pelomonas sp. CA6 TaxID=2907999 RepID=UPI001F4BFA91|nr:Gfo/Idh/MocA family oxidoreductase [Pelomonas sp. CA6]MCH7345237.1 Gfo/Idh/MocA family oxidoreductase [Pelomonas sp. CA6]
MALAQDDALGVGIIGAGHFGAAHARALRQVRGARLVAACRQEARQIEDFCALHGGRPYRDYRALLDDRDVHAVVIATPHALHEEMAVAAARAGKHLLLEKPMAPTVAACRRILAAVRAAGVTLMLGHTMRFSLPFITASRAMAEQGMGRLRLGQARMIKRWMEPNRQPWHLQSSEGGGMLMTAGIHPLDRLLAYAGQRATHVSAWLGTRFHVQPADDCGVILLRFGEEAVGQVSSIGFAEGAFIADDDLVCEHGVLRVDYFHGVRLGRGDRWQDLAPGIEPDWPERALEREWRAFVRSVRERSPPAVSGDDGLHAVACVEAALRSARERREVEVEPC